MPQATAPANLQLGIFFDGTGNHLANARLDDASNIAKLFVLYPHSPDTQQWRLYIEGIGTREGQADSAFAMATGQGSLGWQAALDKAHDGVIELLRGWVRQQPNRAIRSITLDLFGFSRGAACARHFANDLHSDGTLNQALRSCKIIAAAMHPSALQIGFMGLFDTVAAITGPGTSPRLQLHDGMARHIVHLVAADEHRHNFPLSSAGAYDRFVPGAHGDVGGGYAPLMEEQLILTRPDGSFTAPHRAVDSAPSYLRSMARRADHARQQPDYGFVTQVRTWTKNKYSSARGDRVEEVQVHAAIEGRRTVNNDLSRVYLQAMHQLAIAAGAPLAPLTQPAFADELQPIADKLLALACGQTPAVPLSASEQALLYRRYIHHSSH